MRATLAASSLQLRPGIPSTIDVEVTNTAPVIDGLTATVHGLDPAWVQLAQPVVTLFPDAAGIITLRFDVPPSCPAGESMLTIRVYSTLDPERMVEHALLVSVEPVEAAEMEIRPSLVLAGREATMQVVILNKGNTVSEFGVEAVEPTRVVECRTDPITVEVQPGERAQTTVTARGPRPWFGTTAERTIQITATSPTLELTGTARFQQKPYVPRGVITALILAAIVALWATIFLFVIRYLRAGAAPAKAVPASWLHGAREVGLADVAAVVNGTVVADSTGGPLPRITVQAYRNDAHGKPVMVSSAVTGDDGTYSLGGLLPGKYRVRFSADGFVPMWYPNAPDEKAALAFPLEPLQQQNGVSIKLHGGTGALIGQLTPPQGANPNAPATITVTMLPETPTQTVPPPVTITATGAFTVPGLVTPARYEVRIQRPGFDAQVFVVDVGGGQAAVLDTVNLQAANGSIAGQVVDGNGKPLGGVSVALTSGKITRTITTPTVAPVGAFTIDALEAPRTYVLTFTLDGYTSATVALDLAGGQQYTGIKVVLVGGAGSIGGTVTTSGGQPLGGVAVVVQGGGKTVQSATLTTGTGASGLGTFAVSGLAVPGNYTVTFSKQGFQSETVPVSFTAAGLKSGINVVLRPSTSTLSGTVTVVGDPTAGLTVELANGITGTSRTVVTAGSPSGAYSFANVAPGWYTITVTGTNVQTRVVLVEVQPGLDLTRDIDLPAGP